MNIGSRIKSAREARKMTQEELGVACGTTKQSIFKYETGIITNIPLNRIEKIAEVLGVSPAYLMGWNDAESALSNVGMGFEDISHEMNIPVETVKDIIKGSGLQDTTALAKVIKVAELLVKEASSSNSLGTKSKLRSVARLEDSKITPEQDAQIADYIDYLLSKKKDL